MGLQPAERAYRLMLRAAPNKPAGRQCRECAHAEFVTTDALTIHCRRGPKGVMWSALKDACGLFTAREGKR